MASNSYDTPVLDTYHAVVLAFSDFLTVAIHTILYERDIYPQESFLSARKYNYPVKQSRHPKVCKWIQDAVVAVEVEMLKVRSNAQSVGLSVIPSFLWGHLGHPLSSCSVLDFVVGRYAEQKTHLKVITVGLSTVSRIFCSSQCQCWSVTLRYFFTAPITALQLVSCVTWRSRSFRFYSTFQNAVKPPASSPVSEICDKPKATL